MAEVRSAILFVVVVVGVVEVEADDGVVNWLDAAIVVLELFGAFFDLTFGIYSDIRGPEADGGALAFPDGAGDWFRDESADDAGFDDIFDALNAPLARPALPPGT